jgi:hypothetical protein
MQVDTTGGSGVVAAQHNTTGAEANQQLSYGSLRTPCSRVASKVVDKKEPKREREREREKERLTLRLHLKYILQQEASLPAPCELRKQHPF